jgi:hypothetical protein
MARSVKDAIAWGKSQVTEPTQSWYRLCLSFVRQSFGLPGGIPDAGTAWDIAKYKHRTSKAADIPRGVPVFWELPSVADHVALSLGKGLCLSNDVAGRGKISVVRIDDITRNWGGTLLGWSEDLNGFRIYTPPNRRTVNITRALSARTTAKRVEALQDVVENGSKTAQKHAQAWLAAIEDQQKAHARAVKAREALKKQERV